MSGLPGAPIDRAIKRSVVFAFLVAAFSSSPLCADGERIKIQADFAPAVSLDEDYSTGLGGRVEASYLISPSFSVGGAFGYDYYFPKGDWDERYHASYQNQRMKLTHIIADASYFFSTGMFRAFASAGMGIASVNEEFEYYYHRWVPVDETYSYFSLEPALGLEIGLGDKVFLAASVRALVILGWSNTVSGNVGIGVRL